MESILAIIKQLNGADISPRDKLAKLNENLPKFVKIIEESRTTGKGARVILSAIKGINAPLDPQYYACNGIVFDAETFDLLVVPQPVICSNYKLGAIKKNWDKYTVHAINDGTVINLYYYQDAWRMSSAGGFDVGNMKWLGDSTYTQAFESLFKDCDFSYEKLDKRSCYTIGFRHHEFHPLLTDSQKIWFIQSVNLDTMQVATQCDFLPQQTVVVDSLKNILAQLTSALSDYFVSLQKDDKRAVHNYGVVLRGPAELGEMANIIMESSLMKKIRQLLYNVPKTKHIAQTLITNSHERLQYMILQSYMSTKLRYIMFNLFPQYAEYYKYYDNCFTEVKDRLISGLRNKVIKSRIITGKDAPIGASKLAPDNKSSDTGAKNTSSDNIGRYDHICRKFIPIIESQVTVAPVDREFENIVFDFIFDVASFELYFDAFVKNAAK